MALTSPPSPQETLLELIHPSLQMLLGACINVPAGSLPEALQKEGGQDWRTVFQPHPAPEGAPEEPVQHFALLGASLGQHIDGDGPLLAYLIVRCIQEGAKAWTHAEVFTPEGRLILDAVRSGDDDR